MASALFCAHLPSRIAFRLPSGATNRIRRRPFGSFDTLAIASLSLRIGLSARRDRQLKEFAEGV
jgi:hypothetical protein